VHGKGSLLGRMPGDEWQQFANLRCLLAYQWFFPGKKLLFMGAEIGQVREWSHDRELDWFLSEEPLHAGVAAWVKALNALYVHEPALWNESEGGFEWIDHSDWEKCIVSYRRKPADPEKHPELAFILNFTPVPRPDYGVHLPEGEWELVLNSDDVRFGGSGDRPAGDVVSACGAAAANGAAADAADQVPISAPARAFALLTLPPLGVLVYRARLSRATSIQTGK